MNLILDYLKNLSLHDHDRKTMADFHESKWINF